MARKKKRKPQAPSLSSFDKGLYILLEIIFFSLGVFLFAFAIGNFRRSVFADPHVLAQINYCYPLQMLGLLLAAILAGILETLRRKKQPIFGKFGITYGPPKWKPVYPLFSRAFWNHLQPRKTILTASCIALVIVAVTVITVLVMPLRVCLYDDGTIIRFDCLDRPSEQRDISDIEQLTLYTTTTYKRSGPDPWAYALKMTTCEGQTLYFDLDDFSGSHADTIRKMLKVKSWFSPERIAIEGTRQLEDVVRDQNLTQEEQALLYELFSEP